MKPLLVRDLMTVGVPTCKRDTPVRQVARLLVEKDLEAVCVLDEEGNGIGVVGLEEIIAAYEREGLADLPAEAIMREGMPTLRPDMPLTLAAQFMRDRHTRIAYMIHNAAGIIYPAAYITYRHFLRYLAAVSPEELRDLGITAERQSPLEAFAERRERRRKALLG